MAFADMNAYLAKMAAPEQPIAISKIIPGPNVSGAGVNMVWVSSWLGTGFPGAGAVPSTAATCDRTTAGSLGQTDPLVELRLALQSMWQGTTNAMNVTIYVCDRLVHSGGLSGIVTTAQTVNTPAVPRYTPATDNLMAAIETYVAIGATQTTLTASYTNQAGTAGQTSQPIVIGGTSQLQAAGLLLPISLASGDTGVKSVENVTLAATTGTAGNFGVTIFKPLMAFPMIGNLEDGAALDPITRLGGLMPLIQPGACLWLVARMQGQNGNTITVLGKLACFED